MSQIHRRNAYDELLGSSKQSQENPFFSIIATVIGSKGLSRMTANYHVQFLGERWAEIPISYPTILGTFHGLPKKNLDLYLLELCAFSSLGYFFLEVHIYVSAIP